MGGLLQPLMEVVKLPLQKRLSVSACVFTVQAQAALSKSYLLIKTEKIRLQILAVLNKRKLSKKLIMRNYI